MAAVLGSYVASSGYRIVILSSLAFYVSSLLSATSSWITWIKASRKSRSRYWWN